MCSWPFTEVFMVSRESLLSFTFCRWEASNHVTLPGYHGTPSWEDDFPTESNGQSFQIHLESSCRNCHIWYGFIFIVWLYLYIAFMSQFNLAFRHSQTLQEFLEHQWLDSGVVKIMITATWLVKQFILAKVIQRALKLLPVLVLAWHEMVRPWEMACWEWEQHLGLWRFLLNELDFVSRWKPKHVTTMCCT